MAATGFSVAAAIEAGMTRAQLRSKKYVRPFHGMRALAAPDGLLAKCHSYAPRIGNDEAFSGVTALAIWGLPRPARWLASKHTPELLVPKSHVRDRTGGLKPRRILDARFEREEHLGLPVVPPVLAFLTACRELTVIEATQVADALLTDSELYPGITALERPMATRKQLQDARKQMKRTPGMTVLREALERMRERVESPMETVLRCKLVDAGLPEFEVQPEVKLEGGKVFRPDLGHRASNTYLDYEGGHHWSNEEIIRSDLTRSRNLSSRGARHIRVSKDDLEGRAFNSLVAELRRRTASPDNS